ncbi:MAG: WbqC family protein [Prevotella sp.]|jgi:hypothetical protein|nr:WbqC family protein [Prevotella sp.]
MTTALLTSTYFGPVQWYQKLNRYATCRIECHDSYLKQTYRNRCMIATANGVQALSVPIEKYDGLKCEMKDIRISDHGNWRHLHWNALLSAYGESPFFEFYADDLWPFFEKKWDFLLDFNMEITLKMCHLIDIQPHISLTKEYDNAVEDADDFREVIRPKHPLADEDFMAKPYYQVYKQKFGFQKNLSILDLLMNEGNESIYFL